MASEVRLVYTISKETAKLVKAGKAVFESGGVRDLSGRIIELAKPAVSSVNGKLLSPITMVSSLTNNVQSCFVQRGVNKANAKLDISLVKLEQIQHAISGLASSNVLSWVNCAVGMINCGITVAGFYMTLKKLDEVSEQIQSLRNVIEKNIISDHLEKFDKYRLCINSDIGRLGECRGSVLQATSISDHLDEIAAYLKRVIRDFESKEIDGELGCNIIFNLAIAFAKMLNEYSAQYYYEMGKLPPNYDNGVKVLESIDSQSFKEHLKQYIFFECTDATVEEKYIGYSGAIYSIEYQLGELAYTRSLIHQIEKKDYMNMSEFLNQRLQNDLCYEIEDKVCIPI